MQVLMPILVGLLFSSALFMMLRPNVMRIALGLILLTNGSNLFLFSVGKFSKDGPPVIDSNAIAMTSHYANPVSQSLILTAIVIGFALLSFVIALVYRSVQEFKTHKTDDISLEDVEEDFKR